MRKIIILFMLLILLPLGFGLLTQNQCNAQYLSFQHYWTNYSSDQSIKTDQPFSKRVMVLNINEEITRLTELMVQDAIIKAA
ncbi:MAG: hypothetical protein QXV37_01610, partial [Candidatus Jordarchaeaceae archaeon]